MHNNNESDSMHLHLDYAHYRERYRDVSVLAETDY